MLLLHMALKITISCSFCCPPKGIADAPEGFITPRPISDHCLGAIGIFQHKLPSPSNRISWEVGVGLMVTVILIGKAVLTTQTR